MPYTRKDCYGCGKTTYLTYHNIIHPERTSLRTGYLSRRASRPGGLAFRILQFRASPLASLAEIWISSGPMGRLTRRDLTCSCCYPEIQI